MLKIMDTPALIHIIYASSASPGFTAADLTAILTSARANNSRLSVTGMLLYTAGSFFQTLEGEEAVVQDLLGIISKDTRHSNITKIIEEPIAERDFAEWTMGYSEVTLSDLQSIDGLSDFFREGQSFTDLPAGRAKKLMTAFAHGDWRLHGKKTGPN